MPLSVAMLMQRSRYDQHDGVELRPGGNDDDDDREDRSFRQRLPRRKDDDNGAISCFRGVDARRIRREIHAVVASWGGLKGGWDGRTKRLGAQCNVLFIPTSIDSF